MEQSQPLRSALTDSIPQATTPPEGCPKKSLKEGANASELVVSQRASSLSEWVRNIFPKEKPERGGTIRERGYWEKLDMDRPKDAWRPRRRVTDSFAKSRHSDTEDSDRLIRWNTAKDISQEQPKMSKPSKRVVSASASFTPPRNDDRKFSWVPHISEDSQFSTVPEGTSQVEGRSSDEIEVFTDSPTVAADRRLSRIRWAIEAKKEAHRQRRDLKESGDYLGPQGINPETGRLDIDTPSSSDRCSMNQSENDKIRELREAIKKARDIALEAARNKERELKRLLVAKEKDKMERKQQEKQALGKMHHGLRWQRHTKQWSSAQEPGLSPIAQSHGSGISSRRPSYQVEPRGREDQLIDLTSPEAGIKPDLYINTQEAEASEDTPASGATVVRTPKGQSMLSPRSAAEELYENGIDFGVPAVSFNKQPRGAREASPTYWERIAPPPGKGRRSRIPSRLRTKFNEHVPSGNTQNGAPFLEEQQVRAAQGNTDTLPMLRPASAPQFSYREPQEVPRRNFTLIPKKKSGILGPTRANPQAKVNRYSPVINPQCSETRRTPRHSKRFEGETPKSENVLLRTKLSSHLQAWKKRGDYRSPPGEEVVKPADNLQAKLNLIQRATSQELSRGGKLCMPPTQVDSRTKRVVQGVPQTGGQMHVPKGQKEQSNVCLENLSSTIFAKRGDHIPTDHAWIQDVMQNITDKGNEVMGESVCTPTTTTTGSGRQVSGSSQTSISVHASSMLDMEMQTIIASDGQKLKKISNDPQASQQNLTPNSLPSLGLLDRATPVDTTPMRHSAPARVGGKKVLGKSSPSLRKKEQMEALYNTSPTSMFTPVQGREKSMKHRLTTSIRRMKRAQHFSRHGLGGNALTWGAMGLKPSSGSTEMPNLTVGCVTRKVGHKLFRLDPILDVVMGCPGMYPFHLDAEEDIVTLFSGVGREVSASQWLADCSPLDIIPECASTISWAIVVMVKMYWSVVKPVFDHSSEYWQRSSRSESTFMDVVATVLALPGAFAAVICLV